MKKTLITSLAFVVAVSAALAQSLPLSTPVTRQIQLLQSEKASRTAAQKKMDSRLVFALKQPQNPDLANGFPGLKSGITVGTGGAVMVDINATVTQDLLDAIAAAGGSVIYSSAQFHSVRALLPLQKMEGVAGRADVKFISRAIPAMTRTGSVTSEGDFTHQANRARNTFGADGTGLNIGVLSDSDDHMAESQASGDLPPFVTVLPGQDGVGNGEGTAMMEIVYDLAPGANLFYATAMNGPASFADNILRLRAAGCDIICDDVFYYNESPFQDGPIAQAAERVAEDGALYFSAAGNEGSEQMGTSGTWEGDFMDGGAVAAPVDTKGGNYHMFGSNTFDTVTSIGMATVLFWSDPLGASTNDYDLYVLSADGGTIIDFSTSTQNGTQDPFEIVSSPDVGQRIVVVKANGDPRFLHINLIRGELSVHTAGNVKGHAVATNVFAVAAVDVHTAFPNSFSAQNPVESFSSDGPRRMFYAVDGTPYTPGNVLSTGGIVRQKPDIAAADGVSTSLPFFRPFYGTSAAAPHAAAIAALLKSYNSDLTAADIRQLLTQNALDIMGAGVEVNSGWGIVMPYQAISAAPVPFPKPRLAYVGNVIKGGNGNGMIDFDECNDLNVVVTNRGSAAATGIRGVLTSTTPGVFVAAGTAIYPDIPPAGTGNNRSYFQISTTPDFQCGTRVDFQLVLTSDQGAWTNHFQVSTGVRGKAFPFDSSAPVTIPDADMRGAFSGIVVSNFEGSLAKVTVSLYIPHTFDSDLAMELISPKGTRVVLSEFNGMAGNNYGLACDGIRTTFDDDAADSILAGSAPFAGLFKPEQPLSAFAGLIGDQVNGQWSLHVVDAVPMDTGSIQCWTLSLTPIICTDGGGECAGSDLSVTMKAAPIPAGVGSPLTFTMVVSNAGPSAAKAAFLTQNLPANSILASVAMSQGTYTFDPVTGLFNANLGNVAAGSSVTLIVSVIPSQAGLFTSVATVGSLSLDNNMLNNSASLTLSIESEKADLALTLTDAPDPVLGGGVLTYTMSVHNIGPTAATNVIVTNILPVSVDNIAVTSSQGGVLPVLAGNNTIVALLGNLDSNATATVTITCVPELPGIITDTATVVSDQLDPFPGNNVATVTTTVGKAADIAVSLVGQPDPVAVSNTVTYSVVVTNRGPAAASGLNFTLGLPSGLKLLSSTTSQGTLFTNQATVITGDLGALAAHSQALVTATIRAPGTPRTLTATASAFAPENDPNLDNNIASCTNQVAIPSVTIVAGTATLTSESIRVDGIVEAGEKVTGMFQLKSSGTLVASNVTATLIPSFGVTSPSGSQDYGTMSPGTTVSKPFTFTANSAASDSITATLLVQSGTNMFTNNFTFKMPSVTSFSNSTPILIPSVGKANWYPSAINVAGITNSLVKVAVKLVGFAHTYPHDLRMLVVDPNNRAVVIMSRVAEFGSHPTASDITFDDDALSFIPAQGDISGDTFKPSAYGSLDPFDGVSVSSFKTNLITFSGANPNGKWSLYVIDDSAGDQGSIQGGWQLELTTITPVGKLADLAALDLVAPAQSMVGNLITNTFVITNSGPDTATSVMVTNTLSPELAYIGGTLGANTNAVQILGLGALPAGSNLTVSVIARVLTNGSYSDVLTVGSTEFDLNATNNVAIASGSAARLNADLAVSVSGTTNVVAGGDVSYNVLVVNNGPAEAPGVVITNLLPSSAVFGASSSSQGSVASGLVVQGGTTNLAVVSQLGKIPLKGSATIQFTVNLPNSGMVTNAASAKSLIDDLKPANNNSSFVTLVAGPGPVIQAGNARLVTESAANGAIDPGETVVVDLSLANLGTGPATNLTAKLLPSSGISAASSSGYPSVGDVQSYGLVDKGTSVSRKFAFTASSLQGAPVVLTLAIFNGTTQLADVVYSFATSGSFSYSSAGAIQIPDIGQATPYPSATNITGLTGVVNHVSVTLNGVTHSFPRDINVALVGPNGRSVVLMSHDGGAFGMSNAVLTFSDQSVAQIPVASAITNGTYAPCECGSTATFIGFPSTLTGAGFEAFSGIDPNGPWALYVFDDKRGDSGVIINGWTLTLSVVDYVNSVADLGVSIAPPHPAYVGANLPYVITVTNYGPATADNVVVANAIPANDTVVSATSSQGVAVTNTAGYVYYNLGSIPANTVVSMTTVLRAKSPEVIIATAAVSSDATDLNSTNNTAQSIIQTVVPLESRLSAAYIKGEILQLTILGQPSLSYAVQSSTNLVNWTSISTNTVDVTGKTVSFDQSPTNAPYRFYRVIRLP